MTRETSSNKITIRKVLFLLWPFILILLIYLSTRIAAARGDIVENVYSEKVYPAIARIFSSASRLIPFSLWDLFWALVVFAITACLVLILLRKITIRGFTLTLIRIFALLYALFYITWGYNYYRPKIETRLNWRNTSVDTTLFRIVMDSVISEANRTYIVIPPSDYKSFDSLEEKEYQKIGKDLKIGYPNGTRSPKSMLFSSLFSKFGVSGYFGPFFNEIHINKNLLPIDYPFVLAHEKAHQFGLTSEAEANFAAFVICVSSKDQRLEYSGYQSVLLYFLKDASQMKNYRAVLRKVSSNVIGDLRYRQHYYDSLQNDRMSKIQTKANDVYLKANRINEGVRNYDEVVSLVINWSRNSKIY